MDKQNIKTFEQYITDMELMKDVADGEINSYFYKQYERLFFNQLLMMDVVDNLNENVEDISLKIMTKQWDRDPENFYNSFMTSKRIGFLTPYTVDDLREFDLYKVKGYNIGFAVKKDGDIILVHNNDNVRGIGEHLVKTAIKFGGKKLDHFNGFLTGFYKKLHFKFVNHDEFNDEYAPTTWKYTPINIKNPDESIYAEELIVEKPIYYAANERYTNGRPDVVYRELSN